MTAGLLAFAADTVDANPYSGLIGVLVIGYYALLLFAVVVTVFVARDAARFDGKQRVFGLFFAIGMLAALALVVVTSFVAGNARARPGIALSVLMWGGVIAWLAALVVYTLLSRRWKSDAPTTAFPVPGLPAPTYAVPQFAPGSAPDEPVVLPDTAGHLSALGKVGSISPAPRVPADAPTLHPDKGPRASEIAGNPPLPPGEVKIRSLCCNQKMRNQAEKLGKQRRCPKCGVAPFRYKLEPVDQSPPA